MTFYVYENWTHKRARVHQAECSFCNHGRGTQASDAGRNGKWHGPIADRAVALALANSLRQPDTKVCGTCGG
jgi:F-type H+-transporting ATPase subunit beta